MKSHRTRFILVFTRSDFRRVFGENPFFDSFRLDAHCDGEFELPTVSLERLETAGAGRIEWRTTWNVPRKGRRADRPAESIPAASKRRC
jgi:hypothetical protein